MTRQEFLDKENEFNQSNDTDVVKFYHNIIMKIFDEHEFKVTFDGAESEEGEQVFTLPDQLDELIEKVHNYAVHNCDFYVNGKSYCGI